MAGKITCPNKKCGAKLGNYDWAGVCCSCKEWVVPVRLDKRSCSPIFPLTSFVGLLHPPVEGRRSGVRTASDSEIQWDNPSFVSSLYRYGIRKQSDVALFPLPDSCPALYQPRARLRVR